MENELQTEDQCPLCGEPVGCGITAGNDHCWCFEMPPSPPDMEKPEGLDGQACLCNSCLMKLKKGEKLATPAK
ncbi:cysteine-rich CWC family protein [Parendozoicomonas haliclonae]|uniref:Cysteine-rich CWC n=1 Tax=Parendozoicomonas haliclonae TaxID=1960125 RepID=A0A1X7AIK9_9GAMM|nr:cysteine-rich CWC family protein [Parendozoicomonas haliclonae]SMA45373.1 hypothetical protein EHSB41UT_01905 [Parendozoicomonas haliclonae]